MDINRARISFDFAHVGRRFDLNPDSLRTALEEAIGKGPAQYIANKQIELETHGYDEGRFEADATFEVEDDQHLGRVLLGLEPIVPTDYRVFDKRFGIRLQVAPEVFPLDEGLLVRPPEFGECIIKVSRAGFGVPFVFDAESFLGPPIESAPMLLVRSDWFTLELGDGGAKFETVEVFEGGLRTASEWSSRLGALAALASDGSVISIQFDNRDHVLDLPMKQKMTGPFVDQLPRLARFASGWAKVLELAGIASPGRWKFDQVWEAHGASLAADLLTGAPPTANFAFDNEVLGSKEDEIRALYFATASLAGDEVTYAVQIALKRHSEFEFRSGRITPLDVRYGTTDLDIYGHAIAKQHEICVLIHPDNIVRVEELDAKSSPTS